MPIGMFFFFLPFLFPSLNNNYNYQTLPSPSPIPTSILHNTMTTTTPTITSFAFKHGHISEGALERPLCTNLRKERSLVSPSLPNYFLEFKYSFQKQGTALHRIPSEEYFRQFQTIRGLVSVLKAPGIPLRMYRTQQ